MQNGTRPLFGHKCYAGARQTYKMVYTTIQDDESFVPQLNLFLTNHQVYGESSRVFYRHNCFHFNVRTLAGCEMEVYRSFWYDRPPSAKLSLRNLCLRFTSIMSGSFRSSEMTKPLTTSSMRFSISLPWTC